ncbi:MAG: hypothetical protein ACU837_16315 [Gammaproteobacteria bacterium]
MKKLTKEGKRHQLICLKRNERYRLKKTRKSKSLKKFRNQNGNALNTTLFRAPPIITISDDKNRRFLLKFIDAIGREVINRHNSVHLDLYGVEKLHPSGILLFIAEIQRIVKLKQRTVTIRCIPPKRRIISQVLRKLDFFKIIRKSYSIAESTADNVKHWQFATGVETKGAETEPFLSQYDGKITPSLSKRLYVGITEAMLNAHNHAYIQERKDGLNASFQEKRWWMLSQERDGFLYVAFCDLGVGIPETLPIKHKSVWEKLFNLGKHSDAEIIEAATELKKTRTGRKNRGLGLNQMVTTVTKEFGGVIRIYSNSGLFNAKFSDVKEHRTFKDSIRGTLIEWQIPLPIDITPYENRYDHHS